MPTCTMEGLSKAEALRYHEQGFLGPFAICAQDEMDRLRAHIDAQVLTRDGLNPKNRGHCRHLDDARLYELIHKPALVERAASLLGPDLLCWSTNFWTKEPGGKEIPWHQDFQYWPIEPPLNLTAWIAVDPVSVENSCVRVIPGSHKKILPERPTTAEQIFDKSADASLIDESKAVSMELKPGEFFLFNERLLHQSNKNVSNRRRMGMTVRLSVPFVKVYQDGPPLFPGHSCVLLSGEDRFGLNDFLPHPPQA
ncbi:MAG: phytanoyl-CoA dioxygenase family protein [Planctomycetes bacterium]|nr:phytanoyl-CoA dioxygenase family protein [Planctomycetota bacterium]